MSLGLFLLILLIFAVAGGGLGWYPRNVGFSGGGLLLLILLILLATGRL